MNNFFKVHRVLAIGIAIVLSLALVGVGAVTINHYTLDQDITSTVTVSDPIVELTSYLYEDLNCTVLFSGSWNFGALLSGGSPVTKILYFKASRSVSVPGGYGFGEIDPATVVVTSDINPSVATFFSMVGTPFGSVINGNHPCMITFSVTPVGAGTSNFNISVHGTGV
jgi:hypothetical protein